jgi:uncharacterized protein (TIGR01244 family)
MMGPFARAASAALILASVSSSALAVDAVRKQAVESALAPDVPMLLCVTDDVATSGQPRDSAWPKLAKLGFRTVLTLRTPEETNLPRQKAAAEAAGLRWLNVPVGTPTDGQLDQFLSIVRDRSNMPMLIHCAVAVRVGAFWMVHRVLDDGFPMDRAIQEARQIGMRGGGWEGWAVQAIAARKGPRRP